MDVSRYAELFRTESREHLAEMDAALLLLERDGAAAHITVLFRSTHTIKGMAAAMGYGAVEALSHGLETLLDLIRSGARVLNANLVALLFDGTDALQQSVNDAVEGRSDGPSTTRTALLERLATAALDAPEQLPEQFVLTPAAPVTEQVAETRERATLRHVRIDLRRLDALLDVVGELVINRDRLRRTAEMLPDTTASRALDAVLHDTARLVSALQEEVLRTRMVPVGQVFGRFPRLVRDLARDLGKDITFVTEGRDIELDRSLLDAMGDPIVHLLRNAIDHGLETPEQRRVAGKAPNGRLTLRAARERAAVIIQVEDDGGGIDRNTVLRRAQARGDVGPDVTSLSDDGLLRVLAKAGFSTVASVTSVSGRGVGIDVVARRVRLLGGTLELTSVAGGGSVFTLRLPVTLSIVRALLVGVGPDTYAIPASQVLEALEYDAAAVLTIRGREAVALRDDVVPLLRLRARFGIIPPCDEGSHLVIVEAAGRETALQVDSLIGHLDVVVKLYDGVHGAETLFSGATILGDGTPALIVDLGGLA